MFQSTCWFTIRGHHIYCCFSASTLLVFLPLSCSFFSYSIYLVRLPTFALSFHISSTLFACLHLPCLFFSYFIYLVCFSTSALLFLFHISSTVFVLLQTLVLYLQRRINGRIIIRTGLLKETLVIIWKIGRAHISCSKRVYRNCLELNYIMLISSVLNNYT